jgi:hypothetical protein
MDWDETKTQERMERRSRNRSSSAGSEIYGVMVKFIIL